MGPGGAYRAAFGRGHEPGIFFVKPGTGGEAPGQGAGPARRAMVFPGALALGLVHQDHFFDRFATADGGIEVAHDGLPQPRPHRDRRRFGRETEAGEAPRAVATWHVTESGAWHRASGKAALPGPFP